MTDRQTLIEELRDAAGNSGHSVSGLRALAGKAADALAQDEADAELGRMVRNMPRGFALVRYSVSGGFDAYSTVGRVTPIRSHATPLAALRAAGVEDAEKGA